MANTCVCIWFNNWIKMLITSSIQHTIYMYCVPYISMCRPTFKMNSWYNIFFTVSTFPTEVDDTLIECIENFVVRLYDNNPDITSVNASRLELFYYKRKDFKHMPPSRDALYLQTLRAAYQAGHVWDQTLISCPTLPDPSDWGWTKRNHHWQPLWIIRPTISKSLKHFVTCKCKKICKPPCKCYSAGVKCTTLCTCRGHCFKKDKSCVKIKTSSVLLF